MSCYLKELDLDMGKDEYEMFQDIPEKEFWSTNECNGIPYEEFKKYLEKEINRKYNDVTYDDTPAISYIMYDNNKTIDEEIKLDDTFEMIVDSFYAERIGNNDESIKLYDIKLI